jgi:hypothetical protein
LTDIIKLNQELCDCVNEQKKIEWALSIESNLYKQLIDLQNRIENLQQSINQYYHPISK